MTEQDKPKITLSFTENRKRVSLKQFKKLSRFYLVVVFVIGASEAILDLTGKITFGFLELTFRSLKFEINELFIKEEFAKMYTSPQAHSAV